VHSQTRPFLAWAAGQHWCKQHAQTFRPWVCAAVLFNAGVFYRCRCSLGQSCFSVGLQGSTGASSMHRGSGLGSVQQCWSTLESFTGVGAVSDKAVFSLGCMPALVQAACTEVQALGLCSSAGQCWSFHRFRCSLRQGCLLAWAAGQRCANSMHRGPGLVSV